MRPGDGEEASIAASFPPVRYDSYDVMTTRWSDHQHSHRRSTCAIIFLGAQCTKPTAIVPFPTLQWSQRCWPLQIKGGRCFDVSTHGGLRLIQTHAVAPHSLRPSAMLHRHDSHFHPWFELFSHYLWKGGNESTIDSAAYVYDYVIPKLMFHLFSDILLDNSPLLLERRWASGSHRSVRESLER